MAQLLTFCLCFGLFCELGIDETNQSPDSNREWVSDSSDTAFDDWKCWKHFWTLMNALMAVTANQLTSIWIKMALIVR